MSTLAIRRWQGERPGKRSMGRSAAGMIVLSEYRNFEHYVSEFDSLELADRAITIGSIVWVKAPSPAAKKHAQRDRNR